MGNRTVYQEGDEHKEYDVTTIAETEKAVLIEFDVDEEKWVPKSVMLEWPKVGEQGTARIAQWWADKEL